LHPKAGELARSVIPKQRDFGSCYAQCEEKPMTGILIVTGGSRGIGAATARLAASQGWDVAVNFHKREDRAQQVVNDIRAAGRRAIAVAGDVGRDEEVVKLFATVDRELGRVTGLVNNAGTISAYGLVEDLPAPALARDIEVNVTGVILCAREALRRMCRRHGGAGGSIVNISSRAAAMGMPKEYVHYAATKGAVTAFTIGLAKEVADQGVRVNCVSPGLIGTEIQPPGRFARLGPTVPIGRAGRPEEVAEAVLWLLSEKASYVTGADILVSGGR
jgi:NAD(P)-dependent dehydrogenase (short-subunit alcohol dehydrogenase family)